MSVALIRDGVIRPSENDSHVLTAMLPSSCPQNHAANILPMPDGALMCVWFAGTQEGIADISVWGSRLPAGRTQWSDAVKLSHDDTRSEQNPVLFLAPDNVLWLLWTAQISGNQDTLSSATVSLTTLGKPGARLPPCSINPARSFASRSRCLITVTGCFRLLLPYPTRRKMGRQ